MKLFGSMLTQSKKIEEMENLFNFENIDKENLEKIINEAIQKAIDERKRGLLTEMPYKRGIYKQKIESAFPQLLINWCLVHYCTLTNRERTKNHWKTELKTHFKNMSSFSLKENDSIKNRLKILKAVWYERDFYLPRTISLIVSTKFEDENIDTNSLEYQYTINDCSKYAQNIFNVILLRDEKIIWEYINSI